MTLSSVGYLDDTIGESSGSDDNAISNDDNGSKAKDHISYLSYLHRWTSEIQGQIKDLCARYCYEPERTQT